EDVSSFARRRAKAYADYFSPDPDAPRHHGDPSMSLPDEADLQTLADTFGASPERLSQDLALERHRLGHKVKRQVLCRVVGHRVDCTNKEEKTRKIEHDGPPFSSRLVSRG